MKLLSVNVSPPAEVVHGGKTVTTGIFKEPVDGRVMIRTLNLDGDGQADLVGHGGIYKAAYAYSVENYDYWKRELGRTDFGIWKERGRRFASVRYPPDGGNHSRSDWPKPEPRSPIDQVIRIFKD